MRYRASHLEALDEGQTPSGWRRVATWLWTGSAFGLRRRIHNAAALAPAPTVRSSIAQTVAGALGRALDD